MHLALVDLYRVKRLELIADVVLHTLTYFFMCRKIPRDLTEATLSGAGLSIVAALSMVFLFGMVLRFVLFN